MSSYNTFCIFCGSNTGINPLFTEQAYALGKQIGIRKKTMLYGCGSTGLMKIVAHSAANEGARVIGITPGFFNTDVIEQDAGIEKIRVDSMDQRKVEMAKQAEVFVALPGGYGTLDELFEMLTLNQLLQIKAPVFLLNTAHFYTHLLHHIQMMEKEGFLSKAHLKLLHIVDTVEELFQKLEQ